MELWDAYDNKFNRINDMTLVRGEPITDGVYHLVCDIIVKHTDGSYLLMQRDLRKYKLKADAPKIFPFCAVFRS